MDPTLFDYSAYSDASTPRTPSPRSSVSSEGVPSLEDMQPYQHSPGHYKPSFDLDPLRNILADQVRDDPMAFQASHVVYAGHRGSLLQELYEPEAHHDAPHAHHDMYVNPQSAEPYHGSEQWHHMQHAHPDYHHHATLPPMRSPHEYVIRRNTFPYARREQGEQFAHHEQQGMMHHDGPMLAQHIYGEPMPMHHGSPHLPLSAEPSQLHHGGEVYMNGMHPSPHAGYRDFDEGVKLEEPSPVIVPSQTTFYRGPTQPGLPVSYLSPHTGLPVQHTDDAASKETQYLRRRCFNCHTTEPPSWRRSTLNPGKIVCNKCGLYERTHLRPRPLRFDELRAGNKTRKASKAASAVAAAAGAGGAVAHNPKPRGGQGAVKKEPREFGVEPISRRSSVSSTLSSACSAGSGTSDWDDSVSVYSSASGSAPPSAYNSPSAPAFSIPRDAHSASPPSGIRLPGAPLSEIASLQQQQQQGESPRQMAAPQPPQPYYGDFAARRNNSLPHALEQPRRQQHPGWPQQVPLNDMTPRTQTRPKSASTSQTSPSPQQPIAAA